MENTRYRAVWNDRFSSGCCFVKVLFDISVLGLGYFSQRGRTGIYRAVEALAGQLHQHKEIELDFSAIRSTVTLSKAACYLEDSCSPFCGVRLVEPCQAAGRCLARLNRTLLHAPLPLALHSVLAGLDRLERLFLPGQALPHPVSMNSYDIFHSTFYPLPPASPKGPRRLLTVYDLIPLLFPEYTRKNEQQAVRASLNSIGPEDLVIAISEATKNDLCTFTGIAPERVFVTRLAASGRFFPQPDAKLQEAVRARHHIPDGPYLLSLGTLEPRKNIPAVIRSFAKLVRQEHLHDLNLVLVGTKGWLYSEIFEQIETMKDLRERIIVTGYVDDADLAPLYSGASMFIYPSLYEGFGLPPLEAMQCGIPVITSNTSSLPEVVGDAGLLVDPRDEDALCQAIFDIYRKPSLAAELAARSCARAARFSWNRCADETVAAYRMAALQRGVA